MPDLENRLPELLHRAAAGAPTEGRIERTVLRRARRRRVLNASAAGLATIALIAGTVIGAQRLLRSDRTTPIDESPTPSPTPSRGTVMLVLPLEGAVWPEVDQVSLEAAQALADAGELGWRLDPTRTAAAFAVQVFGWDAADVQTHPIEVAPGPTDTLFAPVSNAGLGPGADATGPPAPATSIVLRQLGEKGERGVWSVIGADSDLIAIDPLPASVRAGSTIEVTGSVSDVRVEWSVTLALLTVDPTDGVAGISPGELIDTISGSVQVPGDALGNVAVVARLFDPEGTTVAVDVVPVAVRGGRLDAATGATGTGASGAIGPTASGPTGPFDQVPSAVLVARDIIANAADTHDFDALEALIDPDHFAYNFDDGSNPVPQWRKDLAVLDTLATILRLPFTTAEGTPDVGTIFVWPSLVDADLTNPTADERAMLETLGISDADVQTMLRAFGGYVGPRTGIAEDGTWRYYVTGGD